MEGFMDIITPAYRAGIENAVASKAPDCWTRRTSQTLHKKVIITYDGDKAGQAATAKDTENWEVTCSNVQIPDAMDPY